MMRSSSVTPIAVMVRTVASRHGQGSSLVQGCGSGSCPVYGSKAIVRGGYRGFVIFL